MHFITFPVASANIFPLSNSKQGGQLVTEFNLKAREMVATNPNVKYPIGPSFLHCMDDFKVQLLRDTSVEDYSATKTYIKGDYCIYDYNTYVRTTNEAEKIVVGTGHATYELKDSANQPLNIEVMYSVAVGLEEIPETGYSIDKTTTATKITFTQEYIPDPGTNITLHYKGPEPFNAEHWTQTTISTSILQIAPGRAVINGHYVETLAPMQIDLNLANYELRHSSKEELYGNLSIGIKTYFSTESTMSGSMLVENTDNMYVGVQLVVAKQSEFLLPEDCPEVTQQGMATADIKLADFTFINGSISASSISPNTDAVRYLPSARIKDFDSILDDKYVSSENLIPGKFYTFSGTSADWCESTSSLMIWDSDAPQTVAKTDYQQVVNMAQFLRDSKGNIHLVIPHKQPDGDITNNNGDTLVYADRVIDFPTASYTNGSSGIVTKEYTDEIKALSNQIKSYKEFTKGRQIAFWDTLTMDSSGKYSHDFPKSLTKYDVGDYIIVREDYTVSASEDEGSAPSTMYIVLPGSISDLTYTDTKPDGFKIAPAETVWAGDDPNTEEEALEYIANFYQKKTQYHVGDYVAYDEGTYKCTTDTKGEWDENCWELVMEYNALTELDFTSYKGNDDGDYFEIDFHTDDDTRIVPYYYEVSGNGPKTWSEAVLLTGGTPLATETQVGGFYNASTDAEYADAGYVYLDDTGHLKLVDYALLRTGALAYQLGADFTVPANQTLEYIQAYLDEAVNARVAFKTKAELSSVPTVIHVYIPLPEEEGILNLYNLDSRFGTAVYVHFTADDKTKDFSNIIINISDCAKIRIDSSITTFTNGPVINVLRSCLYYDAQVIHYITTCDVHNSRDTMFTAYSDFSGFDNLTLWYSRFTDADPDLIVNGMEISQPNVAMTTQEVTFWDETISDDNHYSYALRSITLSGSGKLIGCSLYVSNRTTKTRPIDATKHVIIGGDFVLPQGSSLNYPLSSITSPIKVTGTFTTAYRPVNDKVNWIVTETSFSAQTGIYDDATGMGNGSIAFNSNTELIESTYVNVDTIDGWNPDSFHIFYGGTTV